MGAVSDLDEAELLRRATRAAQGRFTGAEVSGLSAMEGGVSSLTFSASLSLPSGAERRIVLKVAPPGLPPVRNRDVLRQARLLKVLASLEGFPVPAVDFTDAELPPFFAMEFLPGEWYEPRLDVTAMPPTAEVAAERFVVATRALARLQSVTPQQLGIPAEEPVLGPGDELERWHRLFQTLDDDLRPGDEELHARLITDVPEALSPVVQHGDFRCANMLFVDARLQAVIDWEIWSLGDPRFDLAWLVMQTDPPHRFHDERPAADVEAGRLVPTAGEIIEEYMRAGEEQGQRALAQKIDEDLRWFLAANIYKTASTLGVILKRERRREQPSERLLVVERDLPEIVAAGHAVLGGERFEF